MEERLVPLLALGVLLVPLAVFARQLRNVRRGRRSRLGGTLAFAVFASLPVVLYVGVFMALVGIEELTGTALIDEGYARSLLIVAVGGLGAVALGTLLFAVVAAFTRRGAR